LEENLNNRSRQYLMSGEQMERFKSWRSVSIPELVFEDGRPETSSKNSWRRIQETIFPGSGATMLKEGLFRTPTPSSICFLGDVSVEPKYEPRHGTLQNDEGYGSMVASRQRPEVSEEGVVEANVKEPEEYIKDSPADHDTMAAFSSASSIPANDLDTWETELPEKLYKDLRLIDPAIDFVGRLGDAVPPLLRSFALRLGSIGSSKAEREIMLFIYTHRGLIHFYVLSGIWPLTDFRVER